MFIGNKLYTRLGDSGRSLIYGNYEDKDNILFEVMGTVDELSASLSIPNVLLRSENDENCKNLDIVQNELYNINSNLYLCSEINKIDYRYLEEWIDILSYSCPKITHFLKLDGNIYSSHLNLSRTICRRLERIIVTFCREKKFSSNPKYIDNIMKYINRLSDYLFILAFATQKYPLYL